MASWPAVFLFLTLDWCVKHTASCRAGAVDFELQLVASTTLAVLAAVSLGSEAERTGQVAEQQQQKPACALCPVRPSDSTAESSSRGWVTPRRAAEDWHRGQRCWCVCWQCNPPLCLWHTPHMAMMPPNYMHVKRVTHSTLHHQWLWQVVCPLCAYKLVFIFLHRLINSA